jgi:cation diffusion facilitator CzcD-associated flavoprotein CzcO
MSATEQHTEATAVGIEEHDVVIVGSGFAGIAMGTQLRRSGRRSFVILERADDIGGVWRDNTYPGAQVDVQSALYSLSFAQTNWSRLNAFQPEIWAHQKQVVRDEGLAEHLRLGTELVVAEWDDLQQLWRIETTRDTYRARVLITAAGHLSDPKLPRLPGLDTFAGDLFHSARWNHDCVIDGRRVGVIGTGASGAQVVPGIVDRVDSLTLFQRSAPWIAPRNDREFSLAERRMFERLPETLKDLRAELYWAGEFDVPQRHMVKAFLDRLADECERHRVAQLPDPGLRAKLTPDYEVGCKRVLRSDDFYPALCRPAVTVETSSIVEIAPEGVRVDGGFHAIDVLIMCTGFDVAELPIAQRIFGRGGLRLADHWCDGERAYHTTTIHGYPNLFFMNGPHSGLGAGTSIIDIIEVQAGYIRAALDHLDVNDLHSMEIERAAEESYAEEVNQRTTGTVWLEGGCQSWYVDSRNGKVTTLWPDFVSHFRQRNGTYTDDHFRFVKAGSSG